MEATYQRDCHHERCTSSQLRILYTQKEIGSLSCPHYHQHHQHSCLYSFVLHTHLSVLVIVNQSLLVVVVRCNAAAVFDYFPSHTHTQKDTGFVRCCQLCRQHDTVLWRWSHTFSYKIAARIAAAAALSDRCVIVLGDEP